MIKNKTRKTIISAFSKRATSFYDKLFGLLRQSNPRSLIFSTRFGIHTFFLKNPIDVLVLDKNYQVVKAKENLKPNRLFFWNPKYNLVLELPQGFIRKSKTELKDKIDYTKS